MEKITHSKLQSLIHEKAAPCATLYIPLSQLNLEDPHKGIFKKLIANTEELLKGKYSEAEIHDFTKSIKNFNFHKLDPDQDKTLVIFKSKKMEGYWTHSNALPGIAVVSESFHIKPLIENFLPMQEFLVLSLGSDHATLYYGTKKIFEVMHTFEIDYEKTHEKLSVIPEKGLRFFQSLEKLLLSSGYKLKDFFSEPVKRKLYEQVDAKIRRFLNGKNIPLILAGSPSDKSRYRSLNSCYQLKRGSINFTISPLDKDLVDYAHSAAKLIAGTHYENLKKKEISRISKAENEGLLAVGVEEVFKALCAQSVETLFVNRSEVLWGIARWSENYYVLHEHQLNHEDDDLIDEFLEKSLQLGVKIVIVDKDPRFMDKPLVAILKSNKHSEASFVFSENKSHMPLSLRRSNS